VSFGPLVCTALSASTFNNIKRRVGYSEPDYAKVAKQVREWTFRFDGGEKPFEFLEQVEWSTNTYGLDLDMIPLAMPELLKGRALKWFNSNNKQWKTWVEYIESFHTYFLSRDSFTKLTAQVKQRKQVYEESLIDVQTLMRPLGYCTIEKLNIIKENCSPTLRISLRAYQISNLDALTILPDEFEKLEKEREAFTRENKFSRTKSAALAQAMCRRCEDTGDHEPRRND